MNAHLRSAGRSLAVATGLVLVLSVLIPAIAQAELVDYFGQAMPAFRGTLPLSGSSLPTVSVEYAVYEPGHFNAAFGGGDPSNGNDYVYAYQLINAPASPKDITKFTVGLDAAASPSGITEMNDPNPPAGVATSSAPAFAPTTSPYTSAAWTFNTIGIGAKSDILLFTSRYSPEWLTGTVKGTSAMGETGNVPSPLPEPSTLVGVAIAGLLVVLGRRIRAVAGR
jgi:hypothetical protein